MIARARVYGADVHVAEVPLPEHIDIGGEDARIALARDRALAAHVKFAHAVRDLHLIEGHRTLLDPRGVGVRLFGDIIRRTALPFKGNVVLQEAVFAVGIEIIIGRVGVRSRLDVGSTEHVIVFIVVGVAQAVEHDIVILVDILVAPHLIPIADVGAIRYVGDAPAFHLEDEIVTAVVALVEVDDPAVADADEIGNDANVRIARIVGIGIVAVAIGDEVVEREIVMAGNIRADEFLIVVIDLEDKFIVAVEVGIFHVGKFCRARKLVITLLHHRRATADHSEHAALELEGKIGLLLPVSRGQAVHKEEQADIGGLLEFGRDLDEVHGAFGNEVKSVVRIRLRPIVQLCAVLQRKGVQVDIPDGVLIVDGICLAVRIAEVGMLRRVVEVERLSSVHVGCDDDVLVLIGQLDVRLVAAEAEQEFVVCGAVVIGGEVVPFVRLFHPAVELGVEAVHEIALRGLSDGRPDFRISVLKDDDESVPEDDVEHEQVVVEIEAAHRIRVSLVFRGGDGAVDDVFIVGKIHAEVDDFLAV